MDEILCNFLLHCSPTPPICMKNNLTVLLQSYTQKKERAASIHMVSKKMVTHFISQSSTLAYRGPLNKIL